MTTSWFPSRATAILVLVATFASAQDEPRRVEGDVGKRIARYVEDAVAYGFTGSVLAARDGKVLAAFGVGSADLEGKVQNDARTLFELASVTKQFTAAAVLVLVQQGKMKLDDPIDAHLPGVPEDCRAITIRQLLQHTSGMPGSNGRGEGEDLGAVMVTFLAGGPRHPPGSHWEYWNQGYSLLAAIVERGCGGSYVEFCKQQLFAKAGATTACFTGDAPPDGVPVAIGRPGRGEPRSALEHPYGSYGYQYRGMGGAVSSVWDLWHWDRALRGELVLDGTSKKELFLPGLNDYALGWFVKTRDGRVVQQHAGSVRGFLCEVRRYPAENGFLAVLCNRGDTPMGEVANGVEALLFGARRELPVPLSAVLGVDLLGTWQAETARLVVERHDDRLRARIEWGGKTPLTRGYIVGSELGKAQFFDWHTELPLELDRAAGKVTAIRIASTSFRRD